MPTSRELRDNYKAINEANKGKDYFQRQKELFEKEPARFDTEVNTALFQGSQNGGEFLAKIQNWQHTEHKKTILEYSTKFDSSEVNVYKHFTEIEIEKRTAQRTEDIKYAETQGKIDAEKFKKSAKDFYAPDHEESVKLLKILGQNSFEIENYFIERLYKRNGLTRVAQKNIEFEKSFTAGYAPVNEFEVAALASLNDFLIQRFSAIGYSGINADLEIFAKENISIKRK